MCPPPTPPPAARPGARDTPPTAADGPDGDGAFAGTPARVAAVGPYFAVSSGPRADAAGFRPFTALHNDPEPLAAYVAETGRRLGTDQRRVAASTLHIGTAARLWSVALATAALTGRAVDLTPERLWWRTPPSGPIELWLPEWPAGTPGEDVPGALYETVVVRHLGPLDEALRRDFGLSPRILHGNSASALLGAVRVLLARVPDAPWSPLPVATALLAREPLASAGVLTADTCGADLGGAGPRGAGPRGADPRGVGARGADDPFSYRRNSCCLYYRVRGNGYCGDCILARPR
ncbi:(2Fe-2S)-binding protein [Streptomyces lavendulocolor]|uniref:(2Fe-2S)-binding protein n=1 Tax=Streptomyces lavendulocolor TaxID=67316 RepID=A0ABV2WFD1_9ACTN